MADLAGARGEACLQADVRPACREMARLDDPYRRTCLAKVGPWTCLHMRDSMCSFSNRWQRSGDWREKTEREKGGQSVVFSLFSSRIYDFCFLFTPYHCLGTETWQTLFLFVSRRWFDTVSASALEPCWPRVPLLLNVQR